MASTLDRWYTIADKYLLRFSSIDTVVVCRVCLRACVSYLCIIFKNCNVGNVCKN